MCALYGPNFGIRNCDAPRARVRRGVVANGRGRGLGMYSERIRNVIQRNKTLVAPPSATVQAAAELMARKKAGAVLVVDDGRLVGIVTERDVVFRVMAQRRDPQSTLLTQVMTPDPVTVGPDELFGQALQLMHAHHFRHLPVVEDGAPIGIVSARIALDPELEEFVSEAQRRKSLQPRRANRSQ